MKFRYDSETGNILLCPWELSYFARKKNSSSFFSPYEESMPETSQHNVLLSTVISLDWCQAEISADIDAVYPVTKDNQIAIIEIIREKRKKQSAQYLAHLSEAEAAVIGYVFSKTHSSSTLRIVLTFVDPDKAVTRFFRDVSAELLQSLVGALLTRALPFLKICREHGEKIKDFSALPFPFRKIRDGQKEFINESYRAIHSGKRLMVSAPTGIGKTMSALYPVVRAIGEGFCDKVFCLCAKNETGKTSVDAAEMLARMSPEIRTVTITAKERICPFRDEGFSSTRCKRGCVLISGNGQITYEQRRDTAVLSLLENGNIYTPEIIRKTAEEYFVCPYELSLDISEYCDIVICDYNYVFDFSIRIRRYFNDVREQYVFLIDEAHNLPKRGRDTYSASIDLGYIDRFGTMISEEFSDNAELKLRYEALRSVMNDIENYAHENEELDGDRHYGFYKSNEIPLNLVEATKSLQIVFDDCLKKSSVVSRRAEIYSSDLRKFNSVCDLFDSHYTFFAEKTDTNLDIRLICLDPSTLLDRAMSVAKSVIMFSATLSPMDYFADICGSAKCRQLELDSPYNPKNLLVTVVDSISTTLSKRNETAEEVAEVIMSAVDGREGNYLCFFPSYAYLDRVFKLYVKMTDGIKVIRQTPNMDRTERRAFLSSFETGKEGETVVGFCVLGGMFAEGIDLAGEKLIGAIIVGTGMGSITSEQNILKEYYDTTRENGMDYAYVYPGFNNVLQAAGRVIRSENDRGIVVLIDERYNDVKIKSLFPKHWSNAEYVSDPFELMDLIDKFWNSSEDKESEAW